MAALGRLLLCMSGEPLYARRGLISTAPPVLRGCGLGVWVWGRRSRWFQRSGCQIWSEVGLVWGFGAHRLLIVSTLGSRVITKKRSLGLTPLRVCPDCQSHNTRARRRTVPMAGSYAMNGRAPERRTNGARGRKAPPRHMPFIFQGSNSVYPTR